MPNPAPAPATAPPLVGRLRRYASTPRVVDAVLAGVVFLLGLPAAAVQSTGGVPVAVLIDAGLATPLLWRRSKPELVFAAVALAGLAQWLVDLPVRGADFALLIALYSVATYHTGRHAWAALAVGLAGVGLGWTRFWRHQSLGFPVAAAVAVTGAWLLGLSMRTRRSYLGEVEQRAQRLQLEQQQQARLAAAAERARIARELHDIIAHHVSVMVTQADGAQYALTADPERVPDALAIISATGRQALSEMRRLLGVLRSADDVDTAFAPQPGLGQLPQLVERLGAAGLAVRLVIDGEPVPVDPGVGLTAYRLIQEALTNTLKHAGPATSTVRLHYTPHRLSICIDDYPNHPPHHAPAAAGADGSAAGHGLIGMRERVATFGGQLSSGPRPDGGWQTLARLPLTPCR